MRQPSTRAGIVKALRQLPDPDLLHAATHDSRGSHPSARGNLDGAIAAEPPVRRCQIWGSPRCVDRAGTASNVHWLFLVQEPTNCHGHIWLRECQVGERKPRPVVVSPGGVSYQSNYTRFGVRGSHFCAIPARFLLASGLACPSALPLPLELDIYRRPFELGRAIRWQSRACLPRRSPPSAPCHWLLHHHRRSLLAGRRRSTTHADLFTEMSMSSAGNLKPWPGSEAPEPSGILASNLPWLSRAS